MADVILVPKAGDGKNRKKKGNKHAKNLRRRERKHAHNVRRIERGYEAVAGKCGSSFCSRSTGCEPWK